MSLHKKFVNSCHNKRSHSGVDIALDSGSKGRGFESHCDRFIVFFSVLDCILKIPISPFFFLLYICVCICMYVGVGSKPSIQRLCPWKLFVTNKVIERCNMIFNWKFFWSPIKDHGYDLNLLRTLLVIENFQGPI